MTKDLMIDPPSDNSVKPETNKTQTKTKSKIRSYEWLNDLNQPVRGERALWVAVITQAMMDALSRASSSEARYHKNEAINWLTGNSKNFITVCLNAGFDPDYIRKKAKRTLLNPQNWRAEAGKGKRYLERKEYRKRKKKPACSLTPPLSKTDGVQNVIIGPWEN